ncbi:hypothetical protein [Streptomyces sp. NPDC006863]|uniref:hypothetical protein n=1 Tax=Streptomyces sp. NPDC006863 TaxID=3154779 RepID=UPI0033CE5E4B
MSATFPPLYEYAMAQECPSCAAAPGVVCNAPNKRKWTARVEALRAELGLDRVTDVEPLTLLHKTRQQAGASHKRRDIGNAPWPEDREPGKRYDTLPREAS